MIHKKYIPIAILSIFIICSVTISVYFALKSPAPILVEDINFSDTKREEIQRYVGYENLLSRYLTMPYDVSINTNQQGSFVDIGYLYILFVPLILLTLVGGLLWRWLIVVVSTFLLALSVNFSYLLVGNNQFGASNALQMISAPESNLLHKFLGYIYHFFYLSCGWMVSLTDSISGDADYVTYPIVISGFVISLVAAYSMFEKREVSQHLLTLIIASYGFFFFAFSSGITWYGYLFFLMLLVCIVFFFSKKESKQDGLHQVLKFCFIMTASLWMLIGLVARISNIHPGMAVEHQGKAIISPDVYYYNTGKIKSTSELQDRFITRGFSDTFREINSDLNTKVYKVGTGFTYFIKQNHKRVIFDNQLGIFSGLLDEYQNKYIISDILKASGVKYLIIDLYTPSIDNTPERSLTRKFLQIMEYVNNNESVRLMCTDNLTRVPTTNEIEYSLTGETVRPGNFAIYEIN